MRGSTSDDNSDFLEIGELWSTYFDVVGKPQGRATDRQNYVDQSSETKKLLGDRFVNFGPVFSKLVCFGPHLSAFLISPREGLQIPKML